MFPRIAAVKVEASWGHGRRGVVRCTVRLTRPLTAREVERLADAIEVDGDGDRLFYVCRPEEVEEREELLDRALAAVARSRREVGGRRKQRTAGRPLTPSTTPSAG